MQAVTIRPAAPSSSGDDGAPNITRRQCFELIRYLEQRKHEIEAAPAELRRTWFIVSALERRRGRSPA